VRILIDECVPRPIKRFLKDHDALTVQELGYSSFTNGELLALAEGKFDLFITSDQNLSYQQNLAGRTLAILMLSTNDWDIIKTSEAEIISAIDRILPKDFMELEL
jgi:predicted nuclease of predicted toxin-antitoxin system